MKTREARRDRSWRAAYRKRKVDLAQHMGGLRWTYGSVPRFPPTLDCVCAGSTWAFDKRPLGCGCRKRRHGQPKLSPDMCKSRAHVLEARREWRAASDRLRRDPEVGWAL